MERIRKKTQNGLLNIPFQIFHEGSRNRMKTSLRKWTASSVFCCRGNLLSCYFWFRYQHRPKLSSPQNSIYGYAHFKPVMCSWRLLTGTASSLCTHFRESVLQTHKNVPPCTHELSLFWTITAPQFSKNNSSAGCYIPSTWWVLPPS